MNLIEEKQEKLLELLAPEYVPADDLAKGCVAFLCGEKEDADVEFLTRAGYDVALCRLSYADFTGEAGIGLTAGALVSLFRKKYKKLPVFFLCSGCGNVAFLSSCAGEKEIEGAVFAGLPFFSEQGEKALKKINGFSFFKKENKAYPELTEQFDVAFERPFGVLPKDIGYGRLKSLAGVMEAAAQNVVPPYVPVLIISGEDDWSDAAFEAKLLDCDTSTVERLKTGLDRTALLSDPGIKTKITEFFDSAVDGYVKKATGNYGGENE